jgi:hypothetical protein
LAKRRQVPIDRQMSPREGLCNGEPVQELLLRTQDAPPVPEPTTMIAGALLLLPFGASTLRVLRKHRGA